MKRFLFSFIITILLSFGLFAQPVADNGQLKVEGIQLVNENGKAVTLRGMSFGWHNWWPRFYNQDAVSWLANDWKVDAVRASMGVEPSGGYLSDSANSVEKVKAVVDGAIAAGVYVIIDWHTHNINREAIDFFKLMAETYGDHPNVIYEVFNEPDDESWPEVKEFCTEVIDSIRTIDEDNIILVGSPSWDQDLHLVAADPITGRSNIMYTMHFYAGTHNKWLRDRCDDAMEAGIPIFVSESSGSEASGDGTIDYEEWDAFIQWMEQNNISWFCWSISDKDEASAAVKPSAASTGNWTNDDLSEIGNAYRDLFMKYHYNYEPARIYKAMNKGKNGEALKIGVIGGSITQGHAASTESNRWANLMADWWEVKFPDSEVELINAGWGGTGSDIGVHRAYDDLLVENPDFIVIEFAVNDVEGELATKMMEGLVQQIITAENSPGLMILGLKQDNGTTALKSHKKVADYYNIPVVDFAALIDDQVAEDGLALSEIFVDGLHPNDVGMQYIADFIHNKLDSLYQTLPTENDLPEINTNLPNPLITDIYANTFQFFPDNITPLNNSGWSVEPTGWVAEEAGNQIDFQFVGSAISLVFTQNDDNIRGKAEVWVDDGTPVVIDAYMNEDWGTKYAFQLVEENLSDENHELHIKVIDETSTTGHYVKITRILVAGDIGSAPPIGVTSPFQKGVVNKKVLLDATQSYDPDGEDIAGYAWEIKTKPEGSSAEISNPNDSIAELVPDVAGEYEISLIVTSGFNQSIPEYKTLDIRESNTKPVAVVGNDTLSATDKYFRFDATESYDPDGDAIVYEWKMESKPQASSAYLRAENTAQPQIKFDVEGIYEFSLIVFDSIEYSDKAFITVEARENYNAIDGEQGLNNIRVYPNPASAHFFINFMSQVPSNVMVEIYSILGEKMYASSSNSIENGQLKFETQNVMNQSGIYLIRIEADNKIITKRITIL